jgi:hypothetical protein
MMNARKSLIMLSITALFATAAVDAKTVAAEKVDTAQSLTKKLNAKLRLLDRCVRKQNCTPEEVREAKMTAAKIGGVLAGLTAVGAAGIGGFALDRRFARTRPFYLRKTGLMKEATYGRAKKAMGKSAERAAGWLNPQ